ncbi:MAG: tRNA pseudouridine(55) synthase TruB [Candidatus Falkowbacteria bacterium]
METKIVKPNIFAVYKPVGISSHSMVNRVRRMTGEKRVGHAGTLDPMASGILVVAVGRASTKLLQQHVEAEKEYVATFTLGVTSTTDDQEGEMTALSGVLAPSETQIVHALESFIGTIEQVPPQYSANKINGRRAYKLARQGKTVELRAKIVVIKSIDLLTYTFPLLEIRIVTGSGVYIRSIARDLGKLLGTGAYMSALERTRVGQFGLFDVKPTDILPESTKNTAL